MIVHIDSFRRREAPAEIRYEVSMAIQNFSYFQLTRKALATLPLEKKSSDNELAREKRIPYPPTERGGRTQLKSLAAARSLPHALVCRAEVVLWSTEGQSNTKIAKRLGWAKVTVGKWRQRFLEPAGRVR